MNRVEWTPSVKTVAVVVGCGLGAGMIGMFPIPEIDVRWHVPVFDAGDFVATARQDPGDELVLVVIGSSTCGWSNSDEFEKLVSEGRRAIHAAAQRRGTRSTVVGVSQDERPEKGIEYLRRLGGFDEIAVGRGWRNGSILKYIYSDYPGLAATPQVLVLARTLVREGGQWGVEDERVLVRRVGVAAIGKWIDGGAQLGDIDTIPGG